MLPPDLGADVVAVVLAGGLARRMGGGDKALAALGDRTVLTRVIERVRPQVRVVVLNANGDPSRFAAYGLPVVQDLVAGHPGPLAGILTGMDWARRFAPGCRWVLSVPADAPFLPRDLLARLKAHAVTLDRRIGCAASAGRSHPVVGLWPLDLMEELRKALLEEGLRKVGRFAARYPLATVEWPVSPVDPFFNANSPEDFAEAERLLRAESARPHFAAPDPKPG